MSFVREFYAFAKSRKKLWLLPLVFIFAAFGGLLLLAKGTALAPFIYTIF
jgi:hydrogenase/urease accessory protein HupE